MTEAVFGLVGVLVGALVSGGTDLYLKKREEAANLRQARRLVGDELESIHIAFRLMFRERHVPRLDLENFLRFDAWEANKATLAKAMSDTQWGRLGTLYSGLGLSRHTLIDLGGGAELSQSLVDYCRDVANDAGAAIRVLVGVGATPPRVIEDKPAPAEPDG
jgi:hypothetical protein